jgi:hypothetical protein
MGSMHTGLEEHPTVLSVWLRSMPNARAMVWR